MKPIRNQLSIVAIAVLTGGALFGVGHSMRPETVRIDDAAVAAETASPAPASSVATDSANVRAVMASIVTRPASNPASNADEIQVRTGIIVSMNGERFILRDDSNDTWYHLDDQRTAASFLGKKVRVTGEVDPMTDVIHVESIQEEKA